MNPTLRSFIRAAVLLALCVTPMACVPMPATVIVVVTATPGTREKAVPPAGETTTKATPKPPPAATAVPKAVDTAPTAQPLQPANGAEGIMCAGTFGFGVTCLDTAGWHTFTKGNTPALRSDQIKNIAICPDGKIYIAASSGLAVINGATWSKVDTDDWGGSPDTIACDESGGLWAGHYKGLTFYDGKQATTIKAREFSSDSDSPKDIAVGPEGHVWVVTNSGVAVYDGKTWTIYEEGSGFDKKYFFEVIEVDGKGQPFVGGTYGVHTLSGDKWTLHDDKTLFQTQSLLRDNQGLIWAGTYSHGVNLFDDNKWVNYSRQNSKISSNHVRSMAVDALGRIWLGTEWGLDIFDGKAWTTYWMHNSDLADNEIYAIGVSGNGPQLPAATTKATGSIVGRILTDSVPIAGSIVIACVEYLGFMFSGPTPCSDQPMSRSTKTDADGNFTISDLQTGRYTLTFQGANKGWMILTGGLGIGSKRYTVNEGKPTNLKEIDIAKKE
jgi:hypothetical protein